MYKMLYNNKQTFGDNHGPKTDTISVFRGQKQQLACAQVYTERRDEVQIRTTTCPFLFFRDYTAG
jgi:hypothetical protein